VQRSEHKQRVGGGRGIVEKTKKMSVEYSAINYKVVIAFIIIFRMCRREGV
jgi:hypothetical protein